MMGRAATAQDEIVGDGTTTNVLFIGELMRQAERFLGEGVLTDEQERANQRIEERERAYQGVLAGH